jgi:hypothetical protein
VSGALTLLGNFVALTERERAENGIVIPRGLAATSLTDEAPHRRIFVESHRGTVRHVAPGVRKVRVGEEVSWAPTAGIFATIRHEGETLLLVEETSIVARHTVSSLV